MEFETISAKDFSTKAVLNGVTMRPQILNGSIEGCELTDDQGNTIQFRKTGYSDFQVLRPKRKTKTVYAVKANVPGLGKVTKTYDDESEAEVAERSLRKLDGITEVEREEMEFEIYGNRQPLVPDTIVE